jgi:hypothetical protein
MELVYKLIDVKTPSVLSQEAIDEFKSIYQEEFGKILSDDEVKEIATRLLRFFGFLPDLADHRTDLN